MKTIDEIRKENLAILAKEYGGVGRLADVLERSSSQVSQWLNASKHSASGKPRRFNSDSARYIEKQCNKGEGWLDTDRSDTSTTIGKSRPEDAHSKDRENVQMSLVGTRRIPLISYVQAGLMCEVIDPYAVGDSADYLLTDLDLGQNAFALEIKGDSMLPDFKEGDRIVIDPSVEPMPGDFVVAKNGHEEATFKKYKPTGRLDQNGNLIFDLVPLNSDYAPMHSDVVPLRIIGTMIEHRRYRKK